MKKSKINKPENPGFESTIWINESDIVESASAFGDVALNMSHTLSPYGDSRLNVIFTNGALALELFFKSQLVDRVFEPAYIEIESQSVTTEERYWSQTTPSIVAVHHSRLQVPAKFRTHELAKLFEFIDTKTQSNILASVSKETQKIQTKDHMMEFLLSINNFFIDKRYGFEGFITGVDADIRHLYTLIPVLRGVKSALSDSKTELPFIK
ncbi:hypothetical protein [Pseudomonas sp.]|uniref:hypothetical protein n=1 Tax=Pseudomonas sp. TaxID=306 RepID=UPI003BB6C5AE